MGPQYRTAESTLYIFIPCCVLYHVVIPYWVFYIWLRAGLAWDTYFRAGCSLCPSRDAALLTHSKINGAGRGGADEKYFREFAVARATKKMWCEFAPHLSNHLALQIMSLFLPFRPHSSTHNKSPVCLTTRDVVVQSDNYGASTLQTDHSALHSD